MFKSVITKFVLVCVASAVLIACNTNTPNEDVGVVTGAVAGGLLGSAVGGGTGQVVAIGAGAVAGALIGGAIGRSMDDNDRYQVVTALDSNHRTYWVNDRTHTTYTVVPRKRVHVSGYGYCRRYYTIVIVGGQKQRVWGTACRNPNGNWVAVR